MTSPIGAPAPPAGAARTPEQKLRGAAQNLEGVFVTQLFKAMRDTVPQDGLTSGGAGEDMFTSMFDEHLSSQLPATWHHGIGNALYQQLHQKLPDAR